MDIIHRQFGLVHNVRVHARKGKTPPGLYTGGPH